MRHESSTAAAPKTSVWTVPFEGPANLAELAGTDAYLWLRDREGLVGWGTAARIEVDTGPDRFENAAEAVAELFKGFDIRDEVGVTGTGPVAFGSFTFDENSLGSVLVIPQVVIGRRDGHPWMTTFGREPPAARPRTDALSSDRVRYAGSTVSEIAWLEAVSGALEGIREGPLDKVVLARDVLIWSKTPFEIGLLVARLSQDFPECFTFAVEGLVGATPELLIRRSGDAVESLVLAGSARRGATVDEDADIGVGLMRSDKDLREHDFAVRSVSSILRPLCDRLGVDPSPSILPLANVQHLSTRVRGRLRRPLTALQLAGALHPTAAVCGTPTADALAAIHTLEGLDRGRYAGPVGWVDSRGDGEWAIALRCAEIEGDRARLFAGAGIVEGSLPEDELEETRLKLRAMQSALDPTDGRVNAARVPPPSTPSDG